VVDTIQTDKHSLLSVLFSCFIPRIRSVRLLPHALAQVVDVLLAGEQVALVVAEAFRAFGAPLSAGDIPGALLCEAGRLARKEIFSERVCFLHFLLTLDQQVILSFASVSVLMRLRLRRLLRLHLLLRWRGNDTAGCSGEGVWGWHTRWRLTGALMLAFAGGRGGGGTVGRARSVLGRAGVVVIELLQKATANAHRHPRRRAEEGGEKRQAGKMVCSERIDIFNMLLCGIGLREQGWLARGARRGACMAAGRV